MVIDFLRDMRFAVRTLSRQKAFAGTAILILALALGANIAVFGAMNAVLVKPLPVSHTEHLVAFDWLRSNDSMVAAYSGYGRPGPAGKGIRTSFSEATFEGFRETSRTLSHVFAFADRFRLNVEAYGQAGAASGQLVSGNYFSALGIPAHRGRVLSELDDAEGASAVAVITYRYWQTRFGGDAEVVGRSILINRTPVVIVGVTPEGFNGTLMGETSDFTLTLANSPIVEGTNDRKPKSTWWLRIMGRLKTGHSIEQVGTDLGTAFERSVLESWATRPLDTPNPTRNGMPQLRVHSGAQGPDGPRRDATQVLSVAQSIVAVILLIGSANIASLILARAMDRRREIAVRLALGATRFRIVRLLAAESVVLSILGGAAGVALANWTKNFLGWWPAFELPGVETAIEGRVLAFAGILTLVTVSVSGVLPAVRSTKSDVNRTIARSARRGFTRKALVVAQIAGCMVLLSMTGLALRTIQRLNAADVGFDPRGLIVFRVVTGPEPGKGRQLRALYEDIHESIDAIPGVRSTTFSAMPLLANAQWSETVQGDPGRQPAEVQFQTVRWNFFDTIGLRVLAGRSLSPSDDDRSAPVAVSTRLWHGSSSKSLRRSVGRFQGRGIPMTVPMLRQLGRKRRRRQGRQSPEMKWSLSMPSCFYR